MSKAIVGKVLVVVLGAFASHSYAGERAAGADMPVGAGKTLAGYQRDCGSIADEKKKARCEEANKAMEACRGQKAENVANCVMEQRLRQRP